MAANKWKRKQARSLKHAMELCLEHAKATKNLSVENVADLMGLSSRWTLYKWMENSRMPIILVRSFEFCTGAEYVTSYLCHSAFKLMIDMPTGKRVTDTDINAVQSTFVESMAVLINFYAGHVEADETKASLAEIMEKLAWHRVNVEKAQQPEFEFEVNE